MKPGISYHPLLRTLVSLLLYVGIYYLIFHDIKSILLLVIVIIVHESGHYIAMKILGYDKVKMLFIPLLGAFVSGQPAQVHPSKKMIVLMAGPLPGIIIGMICALIFSASRQYIYFQLAMMFIFLNVFNLLPVTPMDGGQMLETLFFRSNKIVQTIFIALSSMVIGFIAWGTRNYALFIIVIFLLIRVRSIWKKNNAHETVDGHLIDQEEEISLSNTWKAAYSILWLLSMVLPLMELMKISA